MTNIHREIVVESDGKKHVIYTNGIFYSMLHTLIIPDPNKRTWE